MKTEELLKKYRARLVKEAILKALSVGLLIGFASLIVSGFTIWMTGYKQFWISFVIFAVITAAAFALFYFFRFKPSNYYVARRVDALGLEERMITMNEFQGETDYIFERQREDAVSSVAKINVTLLKITIPLALLIILPLVFVLGTGATVLSALSATGVIRPGEEIIREAEEQRTKKYYEVTYLVEGNGMVLDEEVQIIEEGKSTTPVMAVAEDEWAFMMWSDGSEDPVRYEPTVFENMKITAYFVPATGDSPFQGEGDKSKEGDQASDQPGKGQPGDEGEGEGENPSENANDQPGGNAGGGKYDPANQIIDGETYYGGDVFQDYYGYVNEALSQDATTDKGEKDYIDDYFKTIAE
ncbi:MAG: hypothetical protein J6Z34_05950 [Clostridia bacterium]|nr:hypothetical protein [Clostridia bacterium]